MTVSRATDYLRKIGMPDEQITALQAELDQHHASVDHLIDHAVRLHRGTVEHAALEGLLIRVHVEALADAEVRTLFGVLVSRAGQLAAKVEDLGKQRDDLRAALAAKEGTA